MAMTSSTSGVRSGDLLHEITRLRKLLAHQRNATRWQRNRAEMWKQRAQAAKWKRTQSTKGDA